ncbi:carboxypeptidase-like regulatory domain-containing protein [Sediminibacter sp. Hel_I_10]|uniref:carboxypeptidase-like regulatory domain-containing protein n=1 Tax=Sediminibacter sp. Hel_I_10 TaxID=1392490 RepID=UPI00047DD8F0|nr:carboxypeptidase-like regulatory domain-containing protein [Sediminibacter sp. Hel_I_10]
MKKSISLLLLLLTLFACSDDKTETDTTGAYLISGKFVTPNGEDAISKAKIELFKEGLLLKTQMTNSLGEFSLEELTPGTYDIRLSKGLFSASRTVTIDDANDLLEIILETIAVTDLPNIAVVTGSYDHIEDVLYNIGLVNPETQEPLFDIIEGQNIFGRSQAEPHKSHGNSLSHMNRTTNSQLQPNVDFDFADLIESPDLLNSYDIIFLNCGLNESKIEFSNNLTNYVANGGLLYATDWAFAYLEDITNGGEDYIDFYQPIHSGTSLSTEAELLNEDLASWLSLNFEIELTDNTVTIDEFLSSWQVVDTYDTETVIPWLYGPVEYNGISESKYLAYTFLHDEGAVLYSSFHTENETDEATSVERLMQYLVFELSAMK